MGTLFSVVHPAVCMSCWHMSLDKIKCQFDFQETVNFIRVTGLTDHSFQPV